MELDDDEQYEVLTDKLTFKDIKSHLINKDKQYSSWTCLERGYNDGNLVYLKLCDLAITDKGRYSVLLWDDYSLWQGYIEKEYVSGEEIYTEEVIHVTMHKNKEGNNVSDLLAIESLVLHMEEIVKKEQKNGDN